MAGKSKNFEYKQPVPYMGMNQKESKDNLSSLYVEVMENYVPYETFIVNRGGQTIWNSSIGETSIKAAVPYKMGANITITGDTTSGSAVIDDCSSTAGLTPGMTVTGLGIPVATTILSVDSSTQITVSKDATANGNDVTITGHATEYIVYVAGNRIIRATSSGIAQIGTIGGNTNRASMLTFNNNIYVSNETENKNIDAMNGATYCLGLPKATVIPNTDITKINGGSIRYVNDATEVLKYRYVKLFVRESSSVVMDKGGITIPTPITEGTIDMTGASEDQTVRIAVNQYNDPDVTHIYFYRTVGYTADNEDKNTIPTDFFYVGKVANENGIFEDNTPDTSIAPENFVPGKSNLANEVDWAEEWEFEPLPANGIMAVVGQRVFTVDPSHPERLCFTHNFGGSWSGIYCPAGHLYYLKEVQDLKLVYTELLSASGSYPTPSGRPITGLAALGADLYIFTANKTYRLPNAGGNGDLRQMQPIPEPFGCLSHQGMTEKDGWLIVNTNEPGQHGIRFLQGFDYSEDIVGNANTTDMESIADYAKNFLATYKDEIWMGYSSSQNYNNMTMVFKKVRGRWIYFRHTIRMANAVSLSDGTMLVFDTPIKTYLLQDSGHQDNEVSFTSKLHFVPLRNTDFSDIMQLLNGKLFMELSEKITLIYQGNDISGRVSVYPEDVPLNQWDEANWNRYDTEDAASGIFDRTVDVWNLAFDTEAHDRKIQLKLETSNNSTCKFKGLNIRGSVWGVR